MAQKTVRRLLAILMAVVMTIGMVPAAFAADSGYGDVIATGLTEGTYTDDTTAPGTEYEYTVVDEKGDEVAVLDAVTPETVSAVDGLPSQYAGSVTTVTTPGGTTYTLDTDGVDSGSKYLIVAPSNSYAMYAYSSGWGWNTSYSTGSTGVTVSGSNATITDNEAAALWTLTESGSGYTVVNDSLSRYLTMASSGAPTLSTTSGVRGISANGTTGQYSIRNAASSGRYLRYNNGFTTSSSRYYVRLYKQTVAQAGSTYEVSTTGIQALINACNALTSTPYTAESWAAMQTKLTEAVTAKNAVLSFYDTEADANAALLALDTAAKALYDAKEALQADPNVTLVTFEIFTGDSGLYDGGALSQPLKTVSGGVATLSCTATPDAGNRFCYWTKTENGATAYYSNEATITVPNAAVTYTAWFIAAQTEGIIVPITWQRTDETTSVDDDDSQVLTDIDTYSSYTNWTSGTVSYGVNWNTLKTLTVADDTYVWDYKQSGTDGDGRTYPYSSSYVGTYTPVVAATWTELYQPDNWQKGSGRLFRGTFYWPAGYTTADVIKMISFNDANYDFIYNWIAANAGNESVAPYVGATVLPINDDMFIVIHKAEDDMTALSNTEIMDYLTFFTGTTGKGVWSKNGTTADDWGKTVETQLEGQYSVRAFYNSYPQNTASNANVQSFASSYTPRLAHTDGWYTMLNTDTISSKLSGVYGANAEIAGGTEFYFDIYCIDNSKAGAMDRWNLNFIRSPLSVSVNYYYESVTDPTSANYLGTAAITGKYLGDSITLATGTAAAQLNYFYAAAAAKAGNGLAVLDGVQQAPVPYIVVAENNVINVVYTPVPTDGLTLESSTATYTYDGTEKSTTGDLKLYNGTAVVPLYSHSGNVWTWRISDYGRTYVVTYNGVGQVSDTYVGQYPNTISNDNLTVTQNNSPSNDFNKNPPIIGKLTINPAAVNLTYDYASANSYTVCGEPVSFTPSATGKTETIARDDNDDGDTDVTISIVPATNVLYEEGFLTADAAWTTVGTAAARTVTDNESTAYGYSAAYADDGYYSGGSAISAKVTNAAVNTDTAPKATFTFTGTGFDLYSECADNTGVLAVRVSGDNLDTTRLVFADTHFTGTLTGNNGNDIQADTAYQIPVVHMTDLPYGEYTVEVYGTWVSGSGALTVNELLRGMDAVGATVEYFYMEETSAIAQLEKTGTALVQTRVSGGESIQSTNPDGSVTVYVDGFRVYNALQSHPVYTADGEAGPTYISLYDTVSQWPDFVYVEQTTGAETFTQTEYKNNGPEHEVYLAPGAAIAFKVTTGASSRVMVSAKTIAGDTEINGMAVNSNTDQYYLVSSLDGTVTIRNTGANILSLVNLKLIGCQVNKAAAMGDVVQSLADLTRTAVVLDTQTVYPEVVEYADVEDCWYTGGVYYATVTGLMVGVGDGCFSPDTSTTRAMMAAVLFRIDGGDSTGTTNRFLDVSRDAWYYEAAKWAGTTHVVSGVSKYGFAPDQALTREQMVTMLYRFWQYRNPGAAVSGGADLSAFTDRGSVSSWAYDAMSWAVQAGLIYGTSETTLSPGDDVTRAQMAVILTRYCQNQKGA